MGTYRWHQMANLRAYVRDVLSVPVGASSGSGSTSAGGNASSSVGGRNSTSGGSSNSSSYSGSGSGSSGGGGSQSSSGSGTRVRRELAEQTAFVLSACYWYVTGPGLLLYIFAHLPLLTYPYPICFYSLTATQSTAQQHETQLGQALAPLQISRAKAARCNTLHTPSYAFSIYSYPDSIP